MNRQKQRDVRAIGACALIVIASFVIVAFPLGRPLIGAGVSVALLALLLSTPRMRRVLRRLRGKSASRGWQKYYRD